MRVVSQTLDATRFAFSRIETKIQENVSLFRFAQIKIRFTDSLFCFSLFYFGDCLSVIRSRQTPFCVCRLPVANRQGKEKRAFELGLSNARFVLDLLSAVCRYVFSNLIRTRTRRTDS